MTTKPVAPPDSGAILKFPDAPPEEMTAYHHVLFPGYPGFLALHFGNRETTVILSEIAAALFVNQNREGVRYPDLLISLVMPILRPPSPATATSSRSRASRPTSCWKLRRKAPET